MTKLTQTTGQGESWYVVATAALSAVFEYGEQLGSRVSRFISDNLHDEFSMDSVMSRRPRVWAVRQDVQSGIAAFAILRRPCHLVY